MVAPFDDDASDARRYPMDMWAGYPAATRRLLDAVAERAPNRTVVLTGDVHASWVNELRPDFARPERAPVAVEFVGTSISSGGDGSARWGSVTDAALAANPHLRWHQARRGYMTCTVTPASWTTEYRTVPYVTRPGAPVETTTRWRVEHGRPGVQPA